MIAIESPQHRPLPPRAVWSLMASLYLAAGIGMGVKDALANLTGTITDEHATSTCRREES